MSLGQKMKMVFYLNLPKDLFKHYQKLHLFLISKAINVFIYFIQFLSSKIFLLAIFFYLNSKE